MQPMSDRFRARLVLADDHVLVRAGLRLLFTQIPGVEVVAEAGSGRELIEAVRAHAPDVAVTDLSMPDGDGLWAIERLKQEWPALRVIAVSMYDTSDFVRRALRGGADGYVLKGAPPFEMEHALRAVLAGSGYFSAQLSQRLAGNAEPTPREALTARQVDILVRIARGLSAKQIAYELALSSKTVDAHRAAIMTRLQLHDIAGLTLYAVRHGLVDPRDDTLRSGSTPG